jgi:hypothetical protein
MMTQLPGPPAAAGTLLAEQLMLLAFPAEGPLRMGPGSYLSAGLVGAVLTELTFSRCVTVEQHGWSAGRYRIVALGPGTGDRSRTAWPAGSRPSRQTR